MAAARAWAAGTLSGGGAADEDEEAVADARRFGMDDATIAALKEALSRGRAVGFAGVWPVNLPAVRAFLAVASQWRATLSVAGDRLATLWVGLDYAAAAAAWAVLKMELTPADFEGVRTMELVAREAMNGRGS